MKKIKVCYFVSGLKAGGAESMIYNYCKHLNRNLFEFYIVYQHQPAEKNIIEFKEMGFILKQIPQKTRHPIKNYRESYLFLKNNKIDIVHSHMTLMNFIPLCAAKKLGIKLRISHSHNYDNRKKNVFKLAFEHLCKKLCLKYSNCNIACGRKAGEYLFLKKDFMILNNAVDIEIFKYNEMKRKQLRKIFGLEEDDIVIGHIGRFTYQKNHEFILEIIRQLKDNPKIKYMLVGNGELFLRVKQLAKQKQIDNKIIFTGIVDNINEIYSAFDFFILPSRWEGFPVVGVEAQAAGLSCIISDVIDQEIIITDKVKRLSINNPMTWKEEIMRMVTNRDFLDRKQEVQRFNQRGLNIKKEALKLQKIYTEMGNN